MSIGPWTGRGGFALRRGVWRWALRTALERRGRPVPLGLRGGPELASVTLATTWGPMVARQGGPRAGVAGDAAGLSTQGGPTAAIVVHGVLCSGRYMLPLGVELARDRPVLVPDLPGNGLSSGLREPGSVAQLADALMEAATAAGHERVAIVGNSFAAQIATMAAVRHPQRVERLVLLGPTVDRQARSVRRQVLRWLIGAVHEHPVTVPVLARDGIDVGPRRARRLLVMMRDDRMEERLPDVACPTLVIRAENDRVVPLRWAREVTALLPLGRLSTPGRFGHMAHLSGVLVIAPAVRNFLGGDPARSTA